MVVENEEPNRASGWFAFNLGQKGAKRRDRGRKMETIFANRGCCWAWNSYKAHYCWACKSRSSAHSVKGNIPHTLRVSNSPPKRLAERTEFAGGYQDVVNTTKRSVVMDESDFVDKDKLILRGLLFHGFHGVKQEEKKLGQKFLVDLDAWLDLSKAGESDDLLDTVSYTDIYRIAKKIVEGPSQDLLESVAHLIAKDTLLAFPQISAVRVKVVKPHVAVPGTIDHLGVEITRFKKHDGPSQPQA